jgi:hypothetical protein
MKFLGLGSREMMVASIFGVVGGVIASVTERVDAVVTGGNATPLGFVNTYTWLLASAVLFGPTGAVITTEVQAFLGLVTAANPLSWLWPFVNFIFAVVVGSVSVLISRFNRHIAINAKLVLMSISCAILDIPLTYLVVVTILGLPFIFYLMALPVYIILQLVPSTIISYVILKAIFRSRILSTT